MKYCIGGIIEINGYKCDIAIWIFTGVHVTHVAAGTYSLIKALSETTNKKYGK